TTPFDRSDDFAIFIGNQEDDRDAVAYGSSLSYQAYVPCHGNVSFDAVSFATVDRHCPPPGRGSARHNSGCYQFKHRSLAIIEGVTQPVHLLLDITQALVGCSQGSIFRL